MQQQVDACNINIEETLNEHLRTPYKAMNTYNENLWKIDDHLQADVDQIKETLLADHPDESGDKLVDISDKIIEVRHMISDIIFKV